jgi:hypothetical protein
MNAYVISYDAGYEAPFGAARFADIGPVSRYATYKTPFRYFPSHAEAVEFVESVGGTIIDDDAEG